MKMKFEGRSTFYNVKQCHVDIAENFDYVIFRVYHDVVDHRHLGITWSAWKPREMLTTLQRFYL